MISKINHTQLSNDFIENWMNILSGSSVKVFIAICRKTIGWHKDTDYISITQICEITGLSNRGALNAIADLESNNIIIVERSSKNNRKFTSRYSINYSDNISPKNNNSEKSSQGSEKSSLNNSEKSSHTKETTKETILKEKRCVPAEHDFKKLMHNKIKEHFEIYSEKLGAKYYHSGKEAGAIKNIINRSLSLADGDEQKAENIIFGKLSFLYRKLKNPENQYWSEKVYSPSVLIGNWNNLVKGNKVKSKKQQSLDNTYRSIIGKSHES